MMSYGFWEINRIVDYVRKLKLEFSRFVGLSLMLSNCMNLNHSYVMGLLGIIRLCYMTLYWCLLDDSVDI